MEVPTDILHVITNFMTIHEVLALSSTCKRLRTFVTNSYISKDVLYTASSCKSSIIMPFGLSLINSILIEMHGTYYSSQILQLSTARSLRHLKIRNLLTSTTLRQLQLPPHLESLDLMDNSITNFTPLSNSMIKTLNIMFNPCRDISFLQGMRLTSLSISGFELSYEQLCELPYGNPIRDLSVMACSVRDLNFLVNMRALESFTVNSTSLEDISALGQFANTLTQLRIFSKVLVSIGILAHLTNVVTLELCYAVPNTIEPIRHMSSLTHLSLSNTAVDSFDYVPTSVQSISISIPFSVLTTTTTLYIPGTPELLQRTAVKIMVLPPADVTASVRNATDEDIAQMERMTTFGITSISTLRHCIQRNIPYR